MNKSHEAHTSTPTPPHPPFESLRKLSSSADVLTHSPTELMTVIILNEEVRAKIQQAIEPHEALLTIVNRRKLKWYGHVSRSSGLAKTILQSTVKGERRQGREKEVGRQRQGMDRPGVCQVPEGSGEQGKMGETGCEIICGAPTTLAVKGWMRDDESTSTRQFQTPCSTQHHTVPQQLQH